MSWAEPLAPTDLHDGLGHLQVLQRHVFHLQHMTEEDMLPADTRHGLAGAQQLEGEVTFIVTLPLQAHGTRVGIYCSGQA